jgi:hypothetical protein
MKKWFFCLAIYVILIGCTPGDIIIIERPTHSDSLLANTEWFLDYALIDGQEDDRWGKLSFSDDSIYISDGCAGQWYEPVGDEAVYIISEQGDFALAEDRNVVADALEGIVCEEINFETGTTEGITSPWFSSAFEQVVAYELQEEELRLYYPEDRSNVLYFHMRTAPMPPRDIATPNLTGQILDGTSWVLDHALIDGALRILMSHETFEIKFLARSVRIYDGCNHMEYENRNHQPVYVAAENGDFAFPQGQSVVTSTAVGCYLVDTESGQGHDLDGPDFMPEFEDIIAYELSEEQLLLYYPEDKRNVLVFKSMITEQQPTDEPTQTPQLTVTMGPTQTPVPTPWNSYPAPPTPYPAPVIPSPTQVFYP